MTLKIIRKHGMLKRRGLPSITGPMRDALIRLREVAEDDWPYLPLPDVKGRALRALEERDWIGRSDLSDSPQWRITARGLHALKVYEPVVKRDDDICPRCGLNPRPRYTTGRISPYCRPCTSRLARRKNALGLNNKERAKSLCSRCHKRPRLVAATGYVHTYCQHCKNVRSRREHKRQRRSLLKRIQAGEFIKCSREGCSEPRYVTGQTVQDWCYKHYREYFNNRHRRMMDQKGRRKGGRPRKQQPALGVTTYADH